MIHLTFLHAVLRLTVIAAIPIAASSCGRDGGISAELDAVETYISEAPDSALMVLYHIDTKKIQNTETAVRYARLKAEAMENMSKDMTQSEGDMIPLADSILYYLMERSMESAKKGYFQIRHEYDEYRLRGKNITIVLIVLAAAASIAGISWSQYRRIRAKDDETARLIGKLSEMTDSMKRLSDYSRNELKQRDEQIEAMRLRHDKEAEKTASEFYSMIEDLYKVKFIFLDEICRHYYSYSDSRTRRRQILRSVEKQIGNISDDKEYVALESIVDTYRHGVMKLLREEFPQFKEIDFRLLCYLYAGFSSTAASVFLKEDDIGLVYKRKYRLKARIEKSGSAHKALFLEGL